MFKFFQRFGEYTIFLGKVFSRPEKMSLFWRNVVDEIYSLGIQSMPIIGIISIFIGAVITIQTASNLDGGFIPMYNVGYVARQSVVLEFSPTIVALILVGKVGSSISSQLGTMRVTEQIDAMEIIGVNSANFLVLPKIMGMMMILPFLITISMFVSIMGGYLAVLFTGMITLDDYNYGLQLDFHTFDYYYAMVKTVFFAFILTSIPAYYGYSVKGGSVKVAKSSTTAVVHASIAILVINYVITQLMLL